MLGRAFGTKLELVFFIDLINVEEHEKQNVIMINETEIGRCRHCGTIKSYFSKWYWSLSP